MKKIVIPVALLLIAACSGTPVQTQYYLLRSDLELQSRSLSPSKRFALGRIIIAPYIDQPGIVLETGFGEVRPALSHRWAEPMSQGLKQFMRVELSHALGEDVFPQEFSEGDLSVDIRFDQLHGNAAGEALLVAYWWIRRDGEILRSYQLSETRALTSDGYGALTRAEKALLSTLAERIAATLLEAGAAAAGA